ncbi:hypothetical protein Fmac_025101 [Flemingia macrophylla]|uniref:Uncharacterized protein n=1 Tax=Flemingia macrophylla TaxID=520843 RepID=A0ABD1LRV0_9FABA
MEFSRYGAPSPTLAPRRQAGLNVGICIGTSVSIFANKFPGVYTTTCLSPSNAINARFINNFNVLAVSGKYTSPDATVEILEVWLNARKTRGEGARPVGEGRCFVEKDEGFRGRGDETWQEKRKMRR